MQGPSREEDPLKQLADKLRAKNGVEWRSSVLHDQRVEFIRGKDLARYLRSHEEQLQPFVSKGAQSEAQMPSHLQYERLAEAIQLSEHCIATACKTWHIPKGSHQACG